ncbi:MAG TPA: hypothetical protein VMH81_38345 [Bryobacteraceae bacterium]|nr:hypothetical protein [Bryobacteraceae bacterium]
MAGTGLSVESGGLAGAIGLPGGGAMAGDSIVFTGPTGCGTGNPGLVLKIWVNSPISWPSPEPGDGADGAPAGRVGTAGLEGGDFTAGGSAVCRTLAAVGAGWNILVNSPGPSGASAAGLAGGGGGLTGFAAGTGGAVFSGAGAGSAIGVAGLAWNMRVNAPGSVTGAPGGADCGGTEGPEPAAWNIRVNSPGSFGGAADWEAGGTIPEPAPLVGMAGLAGGAGGAALAPTP